MTTQTLPIDLYYAATPNGRKITIMLEELGVPYTVHPISISRGDQFKPEFLAISPNNKIPAIVDPEGPEGMPISIFESGGFGPMLGQANHFARYAKEKIPYAIDRYVNETHRLFRVLNDQLARQAAAGRQYVAGDDVSIADFAILDWSNSYANWAIDEAEFPHWLAWRARMRARAGTARALAFQLPDKPVDLARDEQAQKVLFGQR